MRMATSYVLQTANGVSTLRIALESSGITFTVCENRREAVTARVRNMPSLEVLHSTSDSFLAKSGTAALQLKASESLFHAVLSNPDRDFVELQLPLAPHSWFGLGHLMCQRWPLETASLDLGPFYPFDNGPNGVCTLADPTIISTSGIMLNVDDESSCLHIGLNAEKIDPAKGPPTVHKWGVGVANFDRQNLPRHADDADGDGLLRVQSRAAYDWPYVHHPWKADSPHSHRMQPHLRFSLGATSNVRTACDSLLANVKTWETKPKVTPPLDMMKYPIWTTWVHCGPSVTQSQVVQFAEDITVRDLSHSIMEIDDRWSTKYGDLEFDPIKFPDPGAMVSSLHKMDFRVTLWVTPFADLDSKAVQDPLTREFFVHSHVDGRLGAFEWWQPTRVAALDLTNDKACEWFVSGLQRLCDVYGVDGFKFDAGEPSFLPKDASIAKIMKCPSDYTRLWIERVASKFEVSEVRSGVQRCQGAPPMTRLFDRFSTWSIENGLSSVLSATLTAGILGYPFVLPDMIGGNAYDDIVPDAELMIRWTQLSAAMPAMQFSIGPWTMSTECDRLCSLALRWREVLFWDHIAKDIPLAREKYVPLIRPMWWHDPSTEAARIFDQFFVGDLLVAPVIKKGATGRAVFLPPGSWRRVCLPGVQEKHRTVPIPGGTTVWVSAALDDMPTFEES